MHLQIYAKYIFHGQLFNNLKDDSLVQLSPLRETDEKQNLDYAISKVYSYNVNCSFSRKWP